MNRSVFDSMTSEQQLWYAKAVISMIMADERVDQSEVEYLESLFRLFKNTPHLAQLQTWHKAGKKIEIETNLTFSPSLVTEVLKNCMSIAISDAEFHSNELKALQHIGKCLGASAQEVDSIVQWGTSRLAHIFAFAS